MLEWVEVDPVNGARTWVLFLDGEPADAADVDASIMFGDD